MSDTTPCEAPELHPDLPPVPGDRPADDKAEDMQALQEILAERHRRCLPGLARMRTLGRIEEGVPMAPHIVPELERAMREVLGELGAAERLLIESLAGTPRGASVAAFLSARLQRLDIVAEEVLIVAGTGDGASLGRRLSQFQTLASAMWKVQLSVTGHDHQEVAAR